MDSFDKSFKSLYDEQRNTALPNYLSWDNVNKGIYEKMPKQPRRIAGVIWLFTGLVIGFASAVFFHHPAVDSTFTFDTSAIDRQYIGDRNHTTSPPHQRNKQEGRVARTSKLGSIVDPNIENKAQSSHAIPSGILADKSLQGRPTSTRSSRHLRANQSIDEKYENKALPKHNATSASFTKKYDEPNLIKISQEDSSITLAGTQTTISEDKTALAAAATVRQPLRINPLSPLNLQLASTSVLNSSAVNYAHIQPLHNATSVNRITVVSGLNRSIGGFTNHLPMATSAKGDWGYDAGVLLSRPIGKGPFFLELGILASEQNQQVQHQSVDQQIVDTTITVTAVNSITGNTISRSTIDTTFQINTVRQLDYPISSQRLQFRTSIGRSYGLGQHLQANIAMGFQVSRLVYQAGYYLDRNERYLSVSSDQPIYRTWSASVAPSIAFEYQLSRRFAAYAGANVQVGLLNGTTLRDAMLRTTTISMMTGVTMTW